MGAGHYKLKRTLRLLVSVAISSTLVLSEASLPDSFGNVYAEELSVSEDKVAAECEADGENSGTPAEETAAENPEAETNEAAAENPGVTTPETPEDNFSVTMDETTEAAPQEKQLSEDAAAAAASIEPVENTTEAAPQEDDDIPAAEDVNEPESLSSDTAPEISENAVVGEGDSLEGMEEKFDIGEPPVYDGTIPINESGLHTQAASEQGLGVTYHSRNEIRAFLKAHPVSFAAPSYKTQPDYSNAPYAAGELDSTTLSNALQMVNNIRYVAGLNYNVTLNDGYSQKTQAASLVMFLNNSLSHTPAKPADISDDLYNLGYSGAGSSNIHYSGTTGIITDSIPNSILYGYMADEDSGNIQRVGHRRWVLNPSMSATGFGAVYGKKGTWNNLFSAMYAFDMNGSGNQTRVAWPAQQMPITWFYNDYPWSLSIGSNITAGNVNVTLTRTSDNKTWSFSQSKSDGDFYVDNNYFGMVGCIIFRPDSISYKVGDEFKVTVTGAGSDTISYNVVFFDPDSDPEEPGEGDNGGSGGNSSGEGSGSEGGKESVSDGNAPAADLGSTSANLAKYTAESGTIAAKKTTVSKLFASTPLTVKKYETSDKSIATVNKKGILTVKKTGDVTITPVYSDGSRGEGVRLHVVRPALTVAGKKTITLDTIGYHLDGNEYINSTVKPSRWVSSKPAVAAVDSSTGMIAALKAGSATISVYFGNETDTLLRLKLKIRVRLPKLSNKSLKLKKGKSKKLSVKYNPYKRDIYWSSMDTSIATVDNSGRIRAISPGKTVITAIVNGQHLTCRVTVK